MEIEEGSAQAAATETDGQVSHRAESRWRVHVALLVSFGAALAVLILDRGSLTLHVVIGLSFVGLVGVHLGQRHRTVGRLSAQLVNVMSWMRPTGRVAWSDVILGLLTLNVVVSGFADIYAGHSIAFPLRQLTGLNVPFIGWHGLSAVVLACYLAVHVLRRRRRLRNSRIR